MKALHTKLSKKKRAEVAANTKALKVAIKKRKQDGTISVSESQSSVI